ncbi:MAG: zinc ribbon domain-containing protein [Chloroflexi bacterium]|nr:zinc ribbon domain-containing protein [Chloroflexota bacterium]
MTMESGERRYVPDDDCPLFSERLEEQILAVTGGSAPNAGRFCGHCYTPLGERTAVCPHCATETSDRRPVGRIPEVIIEMLQAQRKTESRIVNGFAYLGLTLAVVGGLVLVLGVPYLRAHLIWATIVYAAVLIVGGRVLAGVLGGYYGDRIAYERARGRLREGWAEWVLERDKR